MSMRLPSRLEKPICFAHRGARAHAPENTADAFDLAVRLGATGIESDVWITADNALILTHDGTVGLRRRPIRSLDRAALSDDLITLPELVERVPDHIDLSIDVKDDEAMLPILAWAGDLPVTTRQRLHLCHPSWEMLAEWRSVDAHVRLIDSTALKHMEHGPERRAHQLAEAGIDGVNLRHNEWSGGMSTLFHRFERLCFGWDVQHDHLLAEMFRIGLDGVYSDHVDLMMDALDAHIGVADGGVRES
ncbi:MAG: glycerophosphodiester phosphodiesterase [Acidimicrobiales bacterium]